MLIEAAWSYGFPARISREQRLRQERLAAPIRAIAWKAQERLCLQYRKLSRAGKPITTVTTAENTGNKRGHGSAGITGLKMGQPC